MNQDNRHQDSSQRVVVTGMGILAPQGTNIAEFTELLRGGGTGIRQHDDVFDGRSIWAGIVQEYSASEHFSVEEIESFDRTAQMGYVAAKQAIDNAGISIDNIGDQTALLLGTSHGGRSQLDRFVLAGGNPDEEWVPERLLVTAAHFQQTAAVASKLGIHGPTATLSNACSSSGAAIGYAVELLLAGRCTCAIAGGADGFSRLTFSGFSALGAMADGPCAPFSEPVGLSLGDGAAFIVLETLQSALERNATIYAELWGYGLSWDAYHITAPEPSGDGMNRAIRMAVQRAGIESSEIQYVNVHGTGTRSNDLAETVGLQRYFQGSPPPISATKSQTGHMLGASSAVGVISCIIGMNEDWLPPTANFSRPRSGCEIDVIPNQARGKQFDCFMAQSAAFAGANAVLIGGKLREEVRVKPKACEEAIVISGVGIVSPLGCGFENFAKALCEGRSGIGPADEFVSTGNGAAIAGRVTDFQPRKLMPSINLRRVDRVSSFATIAASMALQSARRWPIGGLGDETGLVVGICRGAALSYEKYLASVHGGQWEKASAVHFPQLVMSSIGGQVSAALGLKGITSSLVGSTAAGMQALVHGWELLRRNPAQQAVVVLAADELAPMYFDLLVRKSQQEGQCRTGKNGAVAQENPIVFAEGSAAFVIERESQARARGAKILARIAGAGLTNDAGHLGAIDSQGTWLSRAYEAAIQEAGIASSAIRVAYGTSLGHGCCAAKETQAFKRSLGADCVPRNINHLTGIAEATSSLFHVAAALANECATKSTPEPVLVSACGEDGTNAAVVVEVQ